MLSGTEGPIKVTVLERSMLEPGSAGIIFVGGGERCLVRFEEGKHKGELPCWVPANYVTTRTLDE